MLKNSSRSQFLPFRIFIVLFLVLNTQPCLAQWTKIAEPVAEKFFSFLSTGKYLFGGTAQLDVLRSEDHGINWTSGGKMVSPDTTTGGVWALSRIGQTLLAGTWSAGIFRSENNALTWTKSSSGIPGTLAIRAIHVMGNDVFAGTSQGMYRSVDSGHTWVAVNSVWVPVQSFSSCAHAGSSLFCAAHGDGPFKSSSPWSSWARVNAGLPVHANIVGLAVMGDRVLLATDQEGIFKSLDSGNTWLESGGGINGNLLYSLVSDSNSLYAGTYRHGVYRSLDGGDTWEPANTGFPDSMSVFSLGISGGNLLAGTLLNGLWKRPLAELTGVLPHERQSGRPFSVTRNSKFDSHSSVHFFIEKKGLVELSISDAKGRQETVLLRTSMNPGPHEVDLKFGNHSIGIRFLTLRTERRTQSLIIALMD